METFQTKVMDKTQIQLKMEGTKDKIRGKGSCFDLLLGGGGRGGGSAAPSFPEV